MEKFPGGLQEKPRDKVLAWFAWLKKEGPNLPRPYADVLDGPIRELRISFSRLEMRILYFIEGHRIVATHGFLKKTPKVDHREIERAKRFREGWLSSQEEGGFYEA
ncbi:MAG: type II toxin-antitoxin system RelE/ParE family toxin [Elusimicrobia bacterium]|nr:type II toxin-antitoxin system RelE/ParE family toxin [Elusimicrobiota bacterium]